MTMTHDEVGDLAAERYVLHEMTEEERDAFEEHYADCVVCAHEVEKTYAFQDSVRASKQCQENVVAFPSAPAVGGWRRFVAPVMAAAAALVIAVTAVDLMYVRPLRMQLAFAQKPSTPFVQVLGELRGEGETVLDRNVANEFFVTIEPIDKATQYRWSIVDGHGVVRQSATVPASQTKNLTLPISIPAKSLEPGSYTLHVISTRQVEYSFVVR